MSDLKEIFDKHSHQDDPNAVPVEDLRHVRVMQDDLDELSGKGKTSKESDHDDVSAARGGSALAGNPFLGADASADGAVAPASVSGNRSKGGEKTNPLAFLSSLSMFVPKRENLRLIGALVALAVLGVAAFAYMTNRNADVREAGNVAEQAVSPTRSGDLGVEDAGTYSASKPNYLNIDTESSSREAILSVLDKAATGVSSMSPLVPVEFLVRDTDNNPIAFSRFAYLLGLKVPETVLSDLDESFSVYMIPEAGGVRRALALSVKDKEAMRNILLSEAPETESAMPSAFAPVLYTADTNVPSQAAFRDGSFGASKTRFAIISSDSDLSFDYMLLGDRLVVGTSKDSFRAVLGRAIQK
ncbi:MAG: hypothetical protein HGA38_03885 [Candidatus Moranbacteria bacterium]|nr:hypothetical protein [Candidatus Moranbacteria bacterium]NTW46016.1 hypothetical protein [Candidatus Moranbacteria bacterium]